MEEKTMETENVSNITVYVYTCTRWNRLAHERRKKDEEKTLCMLFAQF